ncbi:MAG TPA: hypothetical protein VEO96_00320 [Thermoplasmata archaeon]|nr:hypothetical protein [Thermoplasmata archaeon]
MDNTEMRCRIDAAFEFVGWVVERPDRFPDKAVLFLVDPTEVAARRQLEGMAGEDK